MNPAPDPGGPKHVDPVDPDPQHWFVVGSSSVILTISGSQCGRCELIF